MSRTVAVIAAFSKALIRGYRRYLTNTIPFRWFRCTYSRTECCSAYALRMFKQKKGLQAIRLIQKRLRRCQRGSLYIHENSIVWGELYELPPKQLRIQLDQDFELSSTRLSIGRVQRAVYKRLGKSTQYDFDELDSNRSKLNIVIRSAKGFYRSLYALFIFRIIFLFFLLLLSYLSGLLLAYILTATIALILLAKTITEQRRRYLRFEQLRAAQLFSVIKN